MFKVGGSGRPKRHVHYFSHPKTSGRIEFGGLRVIDTATVAPPPRQVYTYLINIDSRGPGPHNVA